MRVTRAWSVVAALCAGCGPSGTTMEALIAGQTIRGGNSIVMEAPLAGTEAKLKWILISEADDLCGRVKAGDFKSTDGLFIVLLEKTGVNATSGTPTYKAPPGRGTYAADPNQQLPNGPVARAWGFRYDTSCTNQIDGGAGGQSAFANGGGVIVDAIGDRDDASGRFLLTFPSGSASGRFEATWCDATIDLETVCKTGG